MGKYTFHKKHKSTTLDFEDDSGATAHAQRESMEEVYQLEKSGLNRLVWSGEGVEYEFAGGSSVPGTEVTLAHSMFLSLRSDAQALAWLEGKDYRSVYRHQDGDVTCIYDRDEEEEKELE